MSQPEAETLPTTPRQTTVHNALANWNSQVRRMDTLLARLSDTALAQQIAPGKNTGTYLVGHLIAVHDGMAQLLGIAERAYTHYDEPFLRQPDGNDLEKPTVATLRADWKALHELLNERLATLTPEEWFSRHAAVSEEDFIKEPHRNKLAVLSSRTLHLAYHLGQLILLPS